jgi:pyruvate/2-oxoglutarate dehydrogenase complex dihydrolipoamide acyltransferase (E2) component
MRNTRLRPFSDASAFRRIAAVAWDSPRGPEIYGSLELRAEPLLDWLSAQNLEEGPRLSITHAVARAVAIILGRHPDLNAVVRRGRLYLREDVDVFVQVLVQAEEGEGALGKADLSGVIVRQADERSTREIASEIRSGAKRVRSGDDAEFQKTKWQAFRFPVFLLRWSLKLVRFLQQTLNLSTTWLGAPRDPFGSALVTSVGMMGIRIGYAPFFPLASGPMIIMIGATEDRVVPEDGQPVVGKVLTLNATFDHRVIDGFHASVIAREMRELLEHPQRLDADG